jgi:hypothetical protein
MSTLRQFVSRVGAWFKEVSTDAYSPPCTPLRALLDGPADEQAFVRGLVARSAADSSGTGGLIERDKSPGGKERGSPEVLIDQQSNEGERPFFPTDYRCECAHAS